MERVQQQISRLYFHHGQFCATYPAPVIVTVIIVLLLFCYPLTYIPLPQNAPYEYSTIPLSGLHPDNLTNVFYNQEERVTRGNIGYVLQIILRQSVNPWHTKLMRPMDALRSPLLTAFHLEQQVKEFKSPKSGKTLADLCLQVGEVKPIITASGPDIIPALPSFACLQVSPTLLWNQDLNTFLNDKDYLTTIYSSNHRSIREIVFGIPWKSTGISQYFLRNVPRVISFSVTVLLQNYDEEFIEHLTHKLHSLYPQSIHIDGQYRDPLGSAQSSDINENDYQHDQMLIMTGEGPKSNVGQKVNLIFYKEQNYLQEYMPLAITYVVLLLYVYFSVRKIEMVKSKWGLAFSACFTVVSSLLMSIGICVYIGLTPTLNGGEIFPYLVVLIGLENVLVVTKSVVATPVDLPVNHRIAQGLSKEGWAITKNLVTELSLLGIGFFTFNPAIQEFCLFAVVGFTTDFFLQMFFFVTVLSIDIRRMELSDLDARHAAMTRSLSITESSTPIPPNVTPPTLNGEPIVSVSSAVQLEDHPIISNNSVPNSMPTQPSFKGHKRKASDVNTSVFIQSNGEVPVYVPRRLRFLYFWAKNRVFQRFFMIFLIGWIVLIVYLATSGSSFNNIFSNSCSQPDHHHHHNQQQPDSSNSYLHNNNSFVDHSVLMKYSKAKQQEADDRKFLTTSTVAPPTEPHLMEDLKVQQELLTPLVDTWKVMAYYWWPSLARYYNLSLEGRHLTVLSPIHLVHILSADEAIRMRGEDSSAYTDNSANTDNRDQPDLSMENLLPRSFTGWADAWLTMGMILTCLAGVSFVMSATYVAMCLFQCIQARKRRRRAPVIRILPLVIPVTDHQEGQPACSDMEPESMEIAGQFSSPLPTLEMICSGSGYIAFMTLTRPSVIHVWSVDSGQRQALIMRTKQFANKMDDNGEQLLKSLHSIWCMVILKGVLYAGCSNGSIECWDLITGAFISSENCEIGAGINKLKLINHSLFGSSHNGYWLNLRVLDPLYRSCDLQSTDTRSLKVFRKVKAHHHPITDLFVTDSEGRSSFMLATVSEDCTGKLYQLDSYNNSSQLVKTFFSQDSLSCVHICHQQYIYLGNVSGSIQLYDLEQMDSSPTFYTSVSSALTSPSLLSTENRIYQHSSGQPVVWIHCNSFNGSHSNSFLSNSTPNRISQNSLLEALKLQRKLIFLSCDAFGEVCFWKVGRRTPLLKLQLSSDVLLTSPSPCYLNDKLILGLKDDLSVINMQNLRSVKSLQLLFEKQCGNRRVRGHYKNIIPIQLTDDGQFLVSLCGDSILIIPASVVRY